MYLIKKREKTERENRQKNTSLTARFFNVLGQANMLIYSNIENCLIDNKFLIVNK